MKYRTIVADPPWEVQRLQSPGAKGFGSHDAHCYIWTINKYVEQTYQIMRAWGFKPSQLLTWGQKSDGIRNGRRIFKYDRVYSFWKTRKP